MPSTDTTSITAIYTGLLLTGLLSSLHCIGMCGPILIGFSQVFAKTTLTIEGHLPRIPPRKIPRKNPPKIPQGSPGKAAIARDFVWYHAGRIWTYAALGFVAGLLGQSLNHNSIWIGGQRTAGLLISVAIIFSGVTLLGVIPGLKLDRFMDGCASDRWKNQRWFQSLLYGQGPLPRLLLGVVMGLLPCGLVYSTLAIVAALPSPFHSAAGMFVFGLGTLPSLTAVLLTSPLLPLQLRAHGTRLAAATIIVIGLWTLTRTLLPHDHCVHDTTHQNHLHQTQSVGRVG